ncbi:glycosyltransferase [Kitasatospora sp. NPDC047058]|uniref:glycosyltransferase n=1 Tax=Kitasatospora sp. NPDC047058 TaxID=3155620 RepID=UPI0033DB52F7
MRVALLTEGVRRHPESGPGGWSDRLAEGLREHDFELYVLAGQEAGALPRGRWLGVHELALRGRRPGGRAPGALRRRQYARAYGELVRALVMPGARGGFGGGLYRLAALAREDGALPAFLASAHARRTLERVWHSPGADTSAGQPLVCDVLVAADLLEQCLRPLSAPWYGTGPGGLGAADLCHVVGGGPAALPALVAKQLHGVPFVVTEHGLHLREQYLGRPPRAEGRAGAERVGPSCSPAGEEGKRRARDERRSDDRRHRVRAPGGEWASHREVPYRWPVRALLLSYFRALTEETYRQAAILTPGSAHDQQWQRRCGADPERTRVVYEGTPAVARAAAGPEPDLPTLAWAGALEPGRDTELVLHAFARVRAELPAARLVVHGEETVGGYRAHCEAVAGRLGVAGAVEFAGRPGSAAAAWESGTVVVFSALSQRSPRLLADAMLSGRAVVSTDVGVAREVVGPTGLLVPPRDPQALAGACLALLRDEERRARLGLAGRLRAQERFAVEPVIGAFREIYLELVSQWPAFPAAAGPADGQPRPFARPAEYWLADRHGGGRAADGDGTEAGGAHGGGPGAAVGGTLADGPVTAADRPGTLAEAV